MKKTRGDKLALKVFIVISILSILVSSYLLYTHYSKEGAKWCDVGESFSCDIVNKGEYSTIDGTINYILGTYLYLPIPNALVSILVFLFILISSLALYKNKSLFKITTKNLLKIIKVLLILSLAYALYLVYIEAYVLMTWCILCLALDVLIVAALASVYFVKI